MDEQPNHIPVLYQDVLDLLHPRPNGLYIDGTLGAGGHTAGILKASAPDGRVLAFDRDHEAINFARTRLKQFDPRVIFVNKSFGEMGIIAPTLGFDQVDGIIFDLGLSSRQLDNPDRGFSYLNDGPLDMRFDRQNEITAASLINTATERKLGEILWRYGEVRSSRRLAELIVQNRPLQTTKQLADLINSNKSPRNRKNPAAQVFQALRIAVNQELSEMEIGVSAAIDLLKTGGRIAVISFHSLEDRFIKNKFRDLSKDCICPPQQPICTCSAQAKLRLITRKVIKARDDEMNTNPRSRSARLRVAEKIA